VRRLALILTIVGVVCCLGPPVLADWEPGDGHKMHFPQLPDKNGWDVFVEYPRVLADDWQCSVSGLVDDVHFWGSWRSDIVGTINDIHLSIHDNDTSGAYSKPGDLLWDADFMPEDFEVRFWDTGDLGWYNPCLEETVGHDHSKIYQVNIENIDDKVGAFNQEAGTIYWLDISVNTTDCQFGWTTADVDQYPDPYTGEHFEDDAVWGDYPVPNWTRVHDPWPPYESLDLAFVITPEPAAVSLLLVGGLLAARRRR
jgi:hypothetical protein